MSKKSGVLKSGETDTLETHRQWLLKSIPKSSRAQRRMAEREADTAAYGPKGLNVVLPTLAERRRIITFVGTYPQVIKAICDHLNAIRGMAEARLVRE